MVAVGGACGGGVADGDAGGGELGTAEGPGAFVGAALGETVGVELCTGSARGDRWWRTVQPLVRDAV